VYRLAAGWEENFPNNDKSARETESINIGLRIFKIGYVSLVGFLMSEISHVMG
jgi:hypothetical protein